jgi:hypothetical protein
MAGSVSFSWRIDTVANTDRVKKPGFIPRE